MSKDEELPLEEQVERIRRKRRRGAGPERARGWLNGLFLLLAACGVAWYYTDSAHHAAALAVVAAGMALKVVEFFIRFMG